MMLNISCCCCCCCSSPSATYSGFRLVFPLLSSLVRYAFATFIQLDLMAKLKRRQMSAACQRMVACMHLLPRFLYIFFSFHFNFACTHLLCCCCCCCKQNELSFGDYFATLKWNAKNDAWPLIIRIN